jgi:cyanophycinase
MRLAPFSRPAAPRPSTPAFAVALALVTTLVTALAAVLAATSRAHAATPAAAAAPAGQGACSGSVVAIGGALKDDNTAVWGRIVELAGGPGARIAVIALSSANPARTAASIGAALERRGARPQTVALTAANADDAALATQLAGVDGVFFSGGEQARLLDALLPRQTHATGTAAAHRETAALAALRALHCRGGVIAGTSAGAAVMSTLAIRDVPDVLAALRSPHTRLREGIEVGPGLGFVQPGVLVDQHFVKRGRIARMLPLMVERGVPLGLGVEEDSAAVVRGAGVEVIGARGVLIVDTSTARREGSGPLAVRDVQLAWLESGDRYDLATRTATPLATRRAATPPAQRSGNHFHGDILGDNTIVAAMTQLAQGTRAHAVGLAFWPEGDGDDAALGFEWTLRADAGSRVHVGAAGDSVTGIRLDVLPVRMARPLYRPWGVPAGAHAAAPGARSAVNPP